MRIDVVIPVYNGSRFIHETLGSVFRQTVRPGRVIVVDDGSTDGSQEIVRQFGEVTLLQNPGKGSASARNWGFRHTEAPFVAFLDYDDLWHPQHLEILSSLLAAHPEHPLAATSLRSFPHGGAPHFDVRQRSFASFDPWLVYPAHDLACAPSITLFRREAIEAAGGWPAAHDPIGDYSLWMRLSAERPVLKTTAITVGYRRHDQSISSTYYRHNSHEYLERTLRVDDDLLQSFLYSGRSEEEKALMRRRNELAHRMVAALRALVSGDPEVLRRRLVRMEASMPDEDMYFRYSLLRYLFYMHQPFYDPSETQRINSDLLLLLDSLPKEAKLTRKVLSEMVVWTHPGLRFFVEYFQRKPWQPGRLSPFLRAVQIKLYPYSFLVPHLTPENQRLGRAFLRLLKEM